MASVDSVDNHVVWVDNQFARIRSTANAVEGRMLLNRLDFGQNSICQFFRSRWIILGDMLRDPFEVGECLLFPLKWRHALRAHS
jgi:hypothetical protein